MPSKPPPVTPQPVEEQPPSKSRRDRSTNYPAHTIGDAVIKAEPIWKNEKKHPVSLQIAAQHMGFKNATSGASAPLISSLRKYGIIESLPNGDVRISDEASVLFIYPPTSPEYMAALKQLAMKPPIFGEVLKKFPDGLPSDLNLRSKLQYEFGFASVQAADTFIRTLRAALGVGGIDLAASAREDGVDGIPIGGNQMPPSQTIVSPSTRPPSPPPPGFGAARAPGAASPMRQERHAWKLGSGVWAEVTITGTLGKRGLDKLKTFVSMLDAENDEDAVEPPVSE